MSETLQLLRQAKDGSSAAFNVLFQRHRARLTALVASGMSPALRARLDPEDVVQEAYLEAARKFVAFEPDHPQAFYRWLTRIAVFKRKEAERALRAAKRGRPASLEAEPPAADSSVAGRAARGERAALIAQAIDTLPDAQADAVRLRYLEGRSVADTAAQLGRSEAAVKALVSRGLTALARRLPRSGT